MFRPFAVTFPKDTYFGSHDAAWVIDYKIRLYAANPTIMSRAKQKGVDIPDQELADVPARLSAMDKMRIHHQVVFPSIWLGVLSENVELEAVLASSYNDFMAERCSHSNGRLHYVAVLPWRRPDLAVAEIKRVKPKGSLAGIFVRGMEWDHPLTDPAFRPIFEEAAAQDLPVCVHVGNGTSPTISRMLEGIPRPRYGDPAPHINPLGNGLVSAPFVVYAFQQIMSSDLLERYPTLRVGFMEAGAEWTVPMIRQLRERRGKFIDDVLGQRVFVACAVDEDLPHIIDRVGVDYLTTQTDYPHGDAFREDELMRSLKGRGDVSEADITRILEDNPQRLFHF